MTFNEAYKLLNKAQKEAVDTIDGPVMVVAGPGTGKTQLLATRVANILQKDDTLLPNNILCLTFTESGQVAMQRRLIEFMGETGAHVAVHTFHSFGTEIIQNQPQYFYEGADYAPLDDLTGQEILINILKDLPYNNLLTTKNQDDFTHLTIIKSRIAEFKKSALTPNELRALIMDNLAFIDYIESPLIELFDVTSFRKASDIKRVDKLIEEAANYRQNNLNLHGYKPLSQIFNETLSDAVEQAQLLGGKTTPINVWKKDWYTKNDQHQPICKQRDILNHLLALAEIYELYQQALDKRRLFDYDDMIMLVVHALENHAELAYELQEQYQYFLIDEFQDTNAGQLRLMTALANHPVNEGRPNILVVGDDDQAIYAFQGAKLNNIISFKEAYTNVKVITLTENYRSSQKILDLSRQIIIQGQDRLENHFNDIDKRLIAKHEPVTTNIQRELFTSQAHEFEWVAQEINNLLNSGQQPQSIAIICRLHKNLEGILPYLQAKNIPVSYERSQNALQQPRIKELIDLARLVNGLALPNIDLANRLCPQVLSADYWQIPPEMLWQISLAAQRHWLETGTEIYWLELMQSGQFGSHLKQIAQFLLEIAKQSHNLSLEEVLDILIGNQVPRSIDKDNTQTTTDLMITGENQFKSPFKATYFDIDLIEQKPYQYINLLLSLSAIRNQLRHYRADSNLSLANFIEFIDLCNEAKMVINVANLKDVDNSIRLLTAHGSKGLEFETVFILSATGPVWESKNRRNQLALSPNMLAIAHNDNPDDRLRLFYVAMTRSKSKLYITNYLTDENGKEVESFGAIEDVNFIKLLPSPGKPVIMPVTETSQLTRAEQMWQDRHYTIPPKTKNELLANRLQNYQLSVTHLHNFLDTENGGPSNFLLTNLLRFPSAISPSAAFGSAIHKSIEKLHVYFKNYGQLLDENTLLDYYNSYLKRMRLNSQMENMYLQKGSALLKQFLIQRGHSLNQNQQAEVNFHAQGVTLDDAKLTGRLDVLEINKLQAKTIDYKTGRALYDWSNHHKSTYEKIKTHRYYQQLLFYKILVDGSRSWGDKAIKLNQAEVVFVEPDKAGKIICLPLDLDDDQALIRFKKIIKAVWQHIQALDFPDVSQYEPNLQGIIDFEDWLIAQSDHS